MDRPAGAESSIRADIAKCLPAAWQLPDGRVRAHTIVFAPSQADVSSGEPVTDVDPHELALWLLASTTRLTSYRPNKADLHQQAMVPLSADWSALVLRDGMGFLSRSDSPEFHNLAVALVHSVYLDVLLLGVLQVWGVDGMSAALADRGLTRGRTRDLIRLERRLFNFRRQVWWTQIGRRNANALLTAYQEQHSLPGRVESLIADVGDGARLAQSVTSARIGAALGIVSLIGVPFPVVYAGAALLPLKGWLVFAIASVCGIVLSVG